VAGGLLLGRKAAAAHTGDAQGEEASAEAAPKAKALPMGGRLSLSARGTTDGKEKGSTCGGAEGGVEGGAEGGVVALSRGQAGAALARLQKVEAHADREDCRQRLR